MLSQKPSPLKRRASTDLLPDLDRVSSEETAQDTNNHAPQQHAQRHASTKQMSALYEQTYIDTIVEIKRLLQYYAVLLAADANPDADSVNNADANANSVAVQDAKTELKAILDDLSSKSELMEMEDMRSVLVDCGIEVDVKQGEAGESVVDVRLI